MWFSLKIYWVPLKKKKDNSAFLDNMFYLKNKNNFKTFLIIKISIVHIKVLIRFCIIYIEKRYFDFCFFFI